ncbi:MAG: hypothetical protein SFW62_00365 [Alphaproteobacteria bacterium]|nr:hypothetical protein [Alphaproteobacteria bacterium]
MKKLILAAVLTTLAALPAMPAAARPHHHHHGHGGGGVSFSFGFSNYYPRPYYGYPYYAPPPVVYATPPVVYAPPTAITYEPAPMPADQTSPTYTDDEGRNCREFQSTAIIDGDEQPTYGTACLQPDGSWRVVP